MTENLVVVSKVKKQIKDLSGLNTSQTYIECLSTYIATECEKAIDRANKNGRKTVMGRDFMGEDLVDESCSESLIVASKVKAHIKDNAGLSTSSQCFPVLTAKLRKINQGAIEHAHRQGRKTVLDRDFTIDY